MSDVSRFQRLHKAVSTDITIYWQGEPIIAGAEDSIASALFAAGIRANRRHPVTNEWRAPFCMMGACFECLVSVNGRQVQACMTPVVEGMQVELPSGPGTETPDEVPEL